MVVGDHRATDLGTIEVQEVDLADAANDVIDLVRTEAAAAGVRIDADLSAAPALGDPTLFTQLTMNLVRNAVLHNADDGFLFIATAIVAGQPTLTVTNSGPELAPVVVATLTEPFVRGEGRTRRNAGGAGPGLAIVASIVRAHGGRLELTARNGGGLRVHVGLPAVPAVDV